LSLYARKENSGRTFKKPEKQGFSCIGSQIFEGVRLEVLKIVVPGRSPFKVF
jgi:hypothetical protein